MANSSGELKGRRREWQMTSGAHGHDGGASNASTFHTSGSAYDAFMGRYSGPLAVEFAAAAGVTGGMSALDLGCGPGALTAVLVDRLGTGAGAVSACDPSPEFVAECARRNPSVEVRQGRAEDIPFDNAAFDIVLAQLVLHFVSDPSRAAAEMRRVLRPGGRVAACVWDSVDGMQMFRLFWDAAVAVDPDASEDVRALRFGSEGEMVEVFESAGFQNVSETTLNVSSTYTDFDELWSGFLAGIGPAGAYCVSLPEHDRAEVRSIMFRNLGAPAKGFTLEAVARCAFGDALK
jgi:SAM-dependent methyltransferase